MKPVMQDKFGSIDGNCWTACVASILEVTLDDVRHLADAYYRSVKEVHLSGRMAAWDLSEVYTILPRDFGVRPVWMRASDGPPPRGYCTVSSPFEGWDTLGHSQVALNGVVVHDPNPTPPVLGPALEYCVLLPVVV